MMDKKRIEIIATSALVIVFILALVNTFKAMKKRPVSGSVSLAVTLQPRLVQPQKEVAEAQKIDAETESLDWAHCPFSGKLYSAGKGICDLKLAGILWDAKTPIAMINDLFLKVGDRVEGNTVVSIKEDRVILNDGNKDFELRLEQ